jgi:hypothetical protein
MLAGFFAYVLPNIPDGLVGNDNLAPVLDLVGNNLELLGDNVDGGTGLTLLEALTAAQNHAEVGVKRSLGLVGDDLVGLAQDGAALRVAEDGPGDAAVLELRGRDLASEGTVGLVVDVLGGNLEALAEVLAGGEQVEGRGSDDNLCVVVRRVRCVDKTGRLHIPTLESSLALLRLLTISFVELRVPFLAVG